MTDRNPHGPTVTLRQWRAARIWLGVLFGVLILGMILVSSWLYPWPSVTTSDETRLLQAPAPGGELIFVRDEVCIPRGVTSVERFIEARPDQFGNVRSNQFDTLHIDQNVAACARPNITRIIIPEYTPVGQEFRVRLVSTTQTPTIWPAVNVSYSPWFTVAEPTD